MVDNQSIAQALMLLMSSSLDPVSKAKIALFLTAPLLSAQQFDELVGHVMDTDLEKQSHQRTLTELRGVFEEPLKRLESISQEAWDSADEG